MTGNADPIDAVTGMASAANVSKSEMRAELKLVLRRFADLATIRAADLSDRQYFYFNGYIYEKDTEEAGDDDGDLIIRDANGVAFVRGGYIAAAANLSDVSDPATAFDNIKQAATTASAGVSERATDAEALLGSDTALTVSPANLAAAAIMQGLHQIGHWPARSFKIPTTDGAASLTSAESTTNKVNDEYIAFANGSTLYAGFSFRAPKKLKESSGALLVEFEWMEAASAAAHVCRWQVEMQAQGDGDTVDSAWGTAVAIDDIGAAGKRQFAMTAAVTPGGSWAAGDKIHVRVARLGGHANDTLDVDARLIGVTLFATIDLPTDA